MKRTDFFRKIATAVIALLLCQPATFGQTYRRIAGWPDETKVGGAVLGRQVE